jgi:hypothetical protein
MDRTGLAALAIFGLAAISHFGSPLCSRIAGFAGVGAMLSACTGADQPKDISTVPTDFQNAPSASSSYEFDSASAWKYLLKQVEFGPRMPGTPGHLACRDFLVEEMKKSCENVRIQPLSHQWSVTKKTVEMWNVLGEQNWKDAKVRVVLIAHWDTRPYADQDPDEQHRNKPILGANDGASGVAVLLELMKGMKTRIPKDMGILYLMTDGEDLGPQLKEMFLGARAFAKNPGSPKPDYGILLDMIGDKNLQVPIEPNSMGYARPLVEAFYRLARKSGMESTFPGEYGPVIEDDHIPINEAGIPTMDLIDFDYEPWHTHRDTADKCSAESLGKIGKMIGIWLTQTPTWSYPKRPSTNQ